MPLTSGTSCSGIVTRTYSRVALCNCLRVGAAQAVIGRPGVKHSAGLADRLLVCVLQAKLQETIGKDLVHAPDRVATVIESTCAVGLQCCFSGVPSDKLMDVQAHTHAGPVPCSRPNHAQ